MKVEILILISVILSSISAVDEKAKDVDGIKCSVVDGVQNYIFDLHPLISEFGLHVPAGDNGGVYYFNVCKNLSRSCNNQTASACYIKGTKEIVIGSESELAWNDGQITIKYKNGEKCDDTRNFTTNVILQCDYVKIKNDFLGVFPHSDHCEINIVMRTESACLPLPTNLNNAKFFVTTPAKKVLNFKPLQSSNHEVMGSDDFFLGFPILYGHNMMCEAGTAVCFVNSTATDPLKKYLNMGSMTTNLKYLKDQVTLKLSSKEVCESNKTYSSEIIFECDRLISGDGCPSFKGTSDCVHRFVWQTSLACAEEKPCQMSTPDGQFYDFSSLKGAQYTAVHPNKTEKVIHFSICSPANSPCDGNVGSCIVTTKGKQLTTTYAGNFNSTLQIDESKNVFLLYENGAQCNADGRKFSTKIEFLLADDKNDELSVLIEDDCEIVLQMKTLLASDNAKTCIAKTPNNEEIDLRPLINYEGNYVATVNEKALPNETSAHNVQYLLNVCRPLNSKYSLNCHGNTAACRTVMVDDKHEEELSLGHFDYSLMTEERDNNTAVIMKYFKGSKCPTDLSEDILTTVTFFCNETSGLGNPILQSIEQHCEYAFDFPTSVLCRDRIISMKDENSCELFNEKLNVSVDLKPIAVFESKEIPMKKIDICDRSVKKRFTINYRQSMILVQYNNTTNQDFQRVEVQLKCSANNATTIVVTADEVLITNESALVCPLLNITPKKNPIDQIVKTNENLGIASNIKTVSEEKTNTGGFSMGYIFLVIVLIVAFGAFYLVLRNPERREIIRNMIKFRSRSNNVRYSRVQLDDESTILLNQGLHVPSDSDDDVILT